MNIFRSQNCCPSSSMDLSKMYSPSIITQFADYSTLISSSTGSLREWSNEGKLIRYFEGFLSYRTFYLNLAKLKVNGAPLLLLPSSSNSFLYKWNPSIGTITLLGMLCCIFSDMVDFPAPGIPQTPTINNFSSFIFLITCSMVNVLFSRYSFVWILRTSILNSL